jgi:hypothetical protein
MVEALHASLGFEPQMRIQNGGLMFEIAAWLPGAERDAVHQQVAPRLWLEIHAAKRGAAARLLDYADPVAIIERKTSALDPPADVDRYAVAVVKHLVSKTTDWARMLTLSEAGLERSGHEPVLLAHALWASVALRDEARQRRFRERVLKQALSRPMTLARALRLLSAHGAHGTGLALLESYRSRSGLMTPDLYVLASSLYIAARPDCLGQLAGEMKADLERYPERYRHRPEVYRALASIFAALKDERRAIEHLMLAKQNGYRPFGSVKEDAVFVDLIGRPEFDALFES